MSCYGHHVASSALPTLCRVAVPFSVACVYLGLGQLTGNPIKGAGERQVLTLSTTGSLCVPNPQEELLL